MKRLLILALVLCLLLCGCNMPALTSPTPTTPAHVNESIPTAPTTPALTDPEPTAPVTEPETTQPTEPELTETETTTAETQTETETTQPTEPEPIELTFSTYPQGTTGLRSITSDQGVTLNVDSNHFFEFPEYPGIKVWKTDKAMMNHINSTTFGCENGQIKKIELLGSDKKTRKVEGDPVEPIEGSTVTKEHTLIIGYWYLRILGISDEGKEFQVILIHGTK